MRSRNAAKSDDKSSDKQKLILSESEYNSSPEHKLEEIKEAKEPLKPLQPFEVDTKPRSHSGSTFAISGVQKGESGTDGKPPPAESKRLSKINMLAESVFGVPTKQAVAEAEATVSKLVSMSLISPSISETLPKDFHLQLVTKNRQIRSDTDN